MGSPLRAIKLTAFVVLLLRYCASRPASKDDHVTMSGEPTHFQVDDKAAELEINANVMGVKINAKPASLQVVSKPGSPSVPIARPAVVVPQLPAPYLPAPFYPSPMVLGNRRTATRRHHFFTDAGAGNYNYKKSSVPRKTLGKNVSKKSRITSRKKDKSKKREWIQRLPAMMPQFIPYPLAANVRVHPLVQQMAALNPGLTRQSIPRLPYIQGPQVSPWPQQMYSTVQRYPSMMPTLRQSVVGNGVARSQLSRAVFVPAFPGYRPMYRPPQAAAFMPVFNPGLVRAPLSGYNGYYDPILSRDFIPNLGTPGMPHIPTPRTLIPSSITGGMNYPGYTPLGLWQRVSKRLTIPRRKSLGKSPRKSITDLHAAKKTRRNANTENETEENEAPGKETTDEETPEDATPGKSRKRRSIKERTEIEKPTEKKHRDYGEKVAKRQFILTRPVIPQAQPVVTYVPVVPSPQAQPPMMVPAPGVDRRNLVLNLPLRTSTAFVLNVPSGTRGPQMYPTIPSGPAGAFYQPVVSPGVLGNEGSNDAMGFQRSVVQGLRAQNTRVQSPGVQSPGVQSPGVQSWGVQRSGIQTLAPNRVQLAELAGIQGQPLFQNNPHKTTLYSTDPLSSQYQDQIFGESSLQDRMSIPRHRRRHRFGNSRDFDEFDREYTYPGHSDDETSSYEDGLTSGSLFDRVDDEGSYNERRLPDGRAMFKKDHVGFGPITVEAKTAEVASRDQDDVTDMDLDSDKRKKIARPRLHLDKRLGIPKPEEYKQNEKTK